MLNIEDLSIKFDENSSPVLDNINMKVDQGLKTMIIGETGSGKSLLLVSILRLLPTSAIVSGSIRLHDEEILTLKDEYLYKIRGNKIGYIPQGSGNSLNPLLTVGRQLEEVLELKKDLSKKQRKEKVISMLKEFNLGNEEKIVKSYPYQLSGGMKQRVLIAMGMSMEAPLILADEPTKGLDKSRIKLVEDSFLKMDDKSLLCVTHDIEFARKIGDNIVVMYAAQQVESCSKEEFFINPLHPYSSALLNALPQNGLSVVMGFAPPKSDFAQHGCRFAQRCMYKMDKCRENPPMFNVGNRKVRCWKYDN